MLDPEITPPQQSTLVPEGPPFINKQPFRDFVVETPEDVRKLRLETIEDVSSEDVLEKVGHSIPAKRLSDINHALAEMLSNAQRPDSEAGPRYITGVYIWARLGQIILGVGDNVPRYVIDGRDNNVEAGRGFSVLTACADRVETVAVPLEEAASKDPENRTKKIVRAVFDFL